jgi:clan AA aspartic protease (TIGR02281 family)
MKLAVVGMIVVAGAASCAPGSASNNGGERDGSITMQKHAGIYLVPVTINNAVTLDFVVDSGAADVSVPAAVVSSLMRAGAIKQTDFLGTQTYRLADGSVAPSATFRIRSLKVGETTLENVTGTVALYEGGLLLGQSFLGRFKSWSIDNTRHELVLE